MNRHEWVQFFKTKDDLLDSIKLVLIQTDFNATVQHQPVTHLTRLQLDIYILTMRVPLSHTHLKHSGLYINSSHHEPAI